MKRITFILFISLILVFNFSSTYASEIQSESELQKSLDTLNITDINLDLNLKIRVPANNAGEETDLWATSITFNDKRPTILVATPYRREVMLIPYINLVKHGYNLIGVDIRGTGSSNGTWQSFGPAEHYDNAWIIDNYIPSQSWSNGKVGMIGPSYMAISQLLASGQIEVDENGEPVHLKALFPLVSKSDAYKDIVMHGGNVNAEFIPMWLGLVDALSVFPPMLIFGEDSVNLDDLQKACDIWEDHFKQLEVPVNWIMDIANALKTDFYETKSAMIYWPKDHPNGWYFPNYQEFSSDLYTGVSGKKTIPSKLPVFLTGGWFDIFTRGTINNYVYGLKDHNSSDKALIMGPWYHIGGSLGLGFNSIMDMSLPARWFDWKIKGINDSFMEEFNVLSYVLGEEKWKALKNWPIPEAMTEKKVLYFSRKRPSNIIGDWFSVLNLSNNYSLKEDVSWTDFGWWLTKADFQHSPESLKGLLSRSSVRWLMGVPALVSQASKLMLNKDIDYLMPWEDERIDELGTLTFTTEPLDDDLEVAGPFKLTFFAKTDFNRPLTSLVTSSILDGVKDLLGYDANLLIDTMDKKDVQWVIEINDVYPEGRARNITSGWLAASHRAYDPLDKFNIDPLFDPFDPFYDFSDKNPDLIDENKVYKYVMEVWPTHAVFKKGHRIRLSISGSDMPHLLPYLRSSKNTIVLDSDHKAKIEFTKITESGEGDLWKWVDNPSEYAITHVD